MAAVILAKTLVRAGTQTSLRYLNIVKPYIAFCTVDRMMFQLAIINVSWLCYFLYIGYNINHT